jgi:hypothetical protein
MKKSVLAPIVALTFVLSGISQAQFIDLVSLGSSTFTIDTGNASGLYSQSGTGVTYSPSVALGDTLPGTFSALNWSSNTDLSTAAYLKISFSGANPNLPMSLELFDSTLTSSIKYQGTTDPTASGSAAPYFKFSLTSGPIPSGFLSSIGGAQITWDGGDGTVNATLQAIATVPEPSTYALLALSGLAIGGYAIRRLGRA